MLTSVICEKNILVLKNLIEHSSNMLTSTILLFSCKYFEYFPLFSALLLYSFMEMFWRNLPYKITVVICEILDRWKYTQKKVYIEDKKKLRRKRNWIHSGNLLDPWISSHGSSGLLPVTDLKIHLTLLHKN